MLNSVVVVFQGNRVSDEPEERDAEDEPFTQELIELKVEYPRDFLMFCASFSDSRITYEATRKKFKEWVWDSELDDYMQAVVLNTNLALNLLPTAQFEDFYHFVENARLPDEIEQHCFRTRLVLQLLAEGSEELTFFSSFWTALIGGAFYAAELQAALIDAYYSQCYSVSTPVWNCQVEGVPLAHHFLAVTGFPDERTGLLTMKTRGMRRFGLPELQFERVQSHLAPDSAYLLRGVAQYLWSGIENIIPLTMMLKLSAEFDLPAGFCDLHKSAASDRPASLIPVSLSWGEPERGAAPLIVAPPLEFATEEEWFQVFVPLLREIRLA